MERLNSDQNFEQFRKLLRENGINFSRVIQRFLESFQAYIFSTF